MSFGAECDLRPRRCIQKSGLLDHVVNMSNREDV